MTMIDESFTSLFTFTAIELISHLDLISSYSLIHMAKLRPVRVAIALKSIIIEKIVKSQEGTIWRIFGSSCPREPCQPAVQGCKILVRPVGTSRASGKPRGSLRASLEPN